MKSGRSSSWRSGYCPSARFGRNRDIGNDARHRFRRLPNVDRLQFFAPAGARYGRLARIAPPGIAIVPDDVVGLGAGYDDRWECREYIPAEHYAVGECASEHRQSEHRHHDEETAPPARARDIIVIMIGAVSSANRDGLNIRVVVIGRGGQEYWCLSARQSRRPIISVR
jgi:hypothetical protein